MHSISITHFTQGAHARLPIAIKWPNDVYYLPPSRPGSEAQSVPQKVAGALIHTTWSRDRFNVVTGIGLNVSNSHPTTCINSIIDQQSQQQQQRQQQQQQEQQQQQRQQQRQQHQQAEVEGLQQQQQQQDQHQHQHQHQQGHQQEHQHCQQGQQQEQQQQGQHGQSWQQQQQRQQERQEFESDDPDPGSTALVVTIVGDRMFCANVGDCRLLVAGGAGVCVCVFVCVYVCENVCACMCAYVRVSRCACV